MADPTCFTVIASSPIDLIFSIRKGRRPPQGGTKGRDKGRWRVGITLCWLVNALCRVVAWEWDTMNVTAQRVTPYHDVTDTPFRWRLMVGATTTVFQST